ncbi:MAG: ABC transporter ATP-binding protein [Planctomycetes bacterium]|nr:ABC transporter ATP-binding protein [Planctomycetota bacterium]
MIRFENASRKYGQKVAVEGLTLSIPPGELFAFLGPNGAGKTTSIKLLVGLLRPNGGRVSVCGHDTVVDVRQAAQCLGYVPDQAFLYEKLSGREHLEFVAEMHGLDPSETAAAIARESEQFGLGEFLDDLTETYSHGMNQRLVFASSLLHDPPVLVVDEPMVGLDPRSARLVKDLLKERALGGKTVFMSTHTLGVAEEIADRVGIIDRGRLLFLGTQADLQRESSLGQGSLEQLFLQLTAESDGHDAEVATS